MLVVAGRSSARRFSVPSRNAAISESLRDERAGQQGGRMTKDHGAINGPAHPGSGSDRIVAVSFLTEQELRNVATGLKRIYPIDTDGQFDDLLEAIRALG
jgi:hypothetical protein